MTTCKNCGHEVDLKFCPNCGQKASVKRLEMKSLLQELPHAVWHIDKGLLFNITELFKRPGYAIKDYLDGKRKYFYHPLSYMLVILAVMLVAMNFLNVHYYDPVQDSWMNPKQTAYWKEYDATQDAWTQHYKFFIPVYLPWMSLIYYLWLRVMKSRYTYAECIVISLFDSAQQTIPQIPVLILAYLVNNTAFTRTTDFIINDGALMVLYFFQFYQLGNPGLKKGWRIILSALGAVFLMAFSLIIIFVFLNLMQKFNL